MIERYVDARELARLMGVSERTVRRMVADGMPSETWGMGRARRFLPSQAMGWAHARANMGATNPPGRRANAAGPEP
jgi:excisionase family DNA binding protein